MPSAFIVGGTGQIGRAISQRLTAEGWDVRLASRVAPQEPIVGQHILFDATAPGALSRALDSGCDLLIDCVAFSAVDAERLIAAQTHVGRIIAISSASVYCDAAGRTLDEAGTCGFPHFPVAIPEHHATVAPGDATYSTRKVAMERHLLNHATVPVTILRPCAIHGPHSKHAREWWFVKRLLDGRLRIPPLPPDVGLTPWSIERNMICASSWPAAKRYAETTPFAVRWLVNTMQGRDWRAVLPQLAAYPRDHFDYVAEDEVMADEL